MKATRPILATLATPTTALAKPGRQPRIKPAHPIPLISPPKAVAPASVPADPVTAILNLIRSGERFLVCSHSRPDGDAVGSVLAMGMLLEQMGKRADLVTADRVPVVYRNLPQAGSIRTAMRLHGPYDAAILLECDSVDRTRLRGLERFTIVNIDHHATGHEWGQLNWLDRQAVSVGEMVYRLVKASGSTITPDMATCLYTTVLTDTGGFIYGSMRASTFALAEELVEAGADPIRVARNTYFATPASKLHLLGAALNNLHREGRLAWLWITHKDMVRTCAAEEDCEGIVNYALSVARAPDPRQPAQQGPRRRRGDCRKTRRRWSRERLRLHPRWAVGPCPRTDSCRIAPRRSRPQSRAQHRARSQNRIQDRTQGRVQLSSGSNLLALSVANAQGRRKTL